MTTDCNNDNDKLSGTSGADTISGGAGNDKISGGSGNDVIDGGAGNDKISGGSGNDLIMGGAGNDKIDGGSGNDVIYGGAGNDKIDGGSGNDAIYGGDGNDKIDGGKGDDLLDGGSGNDKLDGGSGNDTLIGGAGADTLTGGSGKDVFVYQYASDSTIKNWDRITDFTQGQDKIDLVALLGSDNLAWGNKIALNRGVWYQNSGSSTFVFADTSGNGVADFKIELKNTSGLQLTVNDFIGVGGSAPVATDSDLKLDEDTVLAGQLVASDVDGDKLTFSMVSGPAHGKLVVDEKNGTFSYTPDADFNGDDQFTYKVNDGSSESNVATVTLTVNPVNDAPVAADDAGSATEAGVVMGSDATGNVLINDSDVDAGDTKTVTTPGSFAGDHGSLTLNSDGSYTYVVDDDDPAVNALRTIDDTLNDKFSYTMQDAAGVTSTANLLITIHGANDAPVATADIADTDEDSAVNISMSSLIKNDTDVDAGDKLSLHSVDTAGTKGNVTLNGNGGVRYDPNGEFESLAQDAVAFDTFSYTVQDEHGATATASVTVTVNGVNDAPVANPDTAEVMNGIADGNVLNNDTDVDFGDKLQLKVTSLGGENFEGDKFVTGAFGDFFILDNGDWGYNRTSVPQGDDGFEHFTYTIVDPFGAIAENTLTIQVPGTGGSSASFTSNAAAVTVTVTPDTVSVDTSAGGGGGGGSGIGIGGNNAPVAVADEANAETAGAFGNVLGNDMGVDTGDSLFVTEINGNPVDGDAFAFGSYGSLFMTDAGDWSYLLNNAGTDALAQGAAVDDVFGYTMADANGASASSTLTIHFNDAGDFLL